MDINALHSLVTGAIWRAEQLDELGLETAASAWQEVSKLEEEIAKALPVKDAEGRIARRGAVHAALKANDYIRAEKLVSNYLAERGAPKTHCATLRKILKADVIVLSEEFPFAAKYYKPDDVQTLADQLQKSGPFLLAA
ncbi:MAG: hypothetical protein NTX50_22035 [Candidatus Sumerlaeota bacterium]|nr:hypothetical protein [Candidatus Sumerlaeota bacterium]